MKDSPAGGPHPKTDSSTDAMFDGARYLASLRDAR
jgi:hypothetical protein